MKEHKSKKKRKRKTDEKALNRRKIIIKKKAIGKGVYCQHLGAVAVSNKDPVGFLEPPGWGGGVCQISSDGDDQMGAKIKTQKIPRASNKTQKNLWTKN